MAEIGSKTVAKWCGFVLVFLRFHLHLDAVPLGLQRGATFHSRLASSIVDLGGLRGGLA